jgi:hypothetical protein
MELTREQKEKLKEKFTIFINDIKDIMKETSFSKYHEINLNNYLSEYSGLKLIIKNKERAHFSADKLRWVLLWDLKDDKKDDVSYLSESIYKEYTKNNFSYINVILDILQQKDQIYGILRRKIKEQETMLNNILD